MKHRRVKKAATKFYEGRPLSRREWAVLARLFEAWLAKPLTKP